MEQESRTQTELLREEGWLSDRVGHWREMLGEAGFRVEGTMEWNDDRGYKIAPPDTGTKDRKDNSPK